MTVSRPHRRSVAKDVSRALALHDVTFFEVWEALTHFEPPLAEVAARNRTAPDLEAMTAAGERFVGASADTERAVHHTAEFFRSLAQATRNQVFGLVQEPLLDLLEP